MMRSGVLEYAIINERMFEYAIKKKSCAARVCENFPILMVKTAKGLSGRRTLPRN